MKNINGNLEENKEENKNINGNLEEKRKKKTDEETSM